MKRRNIKATKGPGGPVVKTLPSIAEDKGLIPSPGAKILHAL